MTRYIDIDNAVKFHIEIPRGVREQDFLEGIDFALKNIESEPMADVQPVVHCKDCIHRYNADNSNICPMFESHSEYNESWEEWEEIDIDNTDDDNFCKYGDEHEQ